MTEPKIKLSYNENLMEGPCGFCGGPCSPDGLDFMIEGTRAFVCGGCVKEKDPELYAIHNDAHTWRHRAEEKAFYEGREQGIQEGKEAAGRMLADAINEPLGTRLLTLIERELYPKTGGGFPEDDIPF